MKLGGFGILVLAAGASTRMGRPKQLLPWRNKPLVYHVLQQCLATGAQAVGLVLGANFEDIVKALPDERTYEIYRNKAWDKGPGSSIAFGVRNLLATHPELAGILVVLGDQPLLDKGLLNFLMAEARRNREHVIAVDYPEGPGVPALFPPSLFDALQQVSAGKGAVALLRSGLHPVLSYPAGGKERDMDTPEAYRQLKEESGS